MNLEWSNELELNNKQNPDTEQQGGGGYGGGWVGEILHQEVDALDTSWNMGMAL